jgi:prolyl oligopeptidase
MPCCGLAFGPTFERLSGPQKRMKPKILSLLSALVVAAPCVAQDAQSADPYLWLEQVDAPQALDWVRTQNEVAQRELQQGPGFGALEAKLLAILESDDRIPGVGKAGEFYYNFWRDAKNVRGVWRRTTLEEYRKPQPAWETVLDLDALAAAEKENWVWKGSSWLRPGYDRCLVSLSRGGGDAVVVREFDPVAKRFVDDGFVMAEAKSRFAWKDRDTLYVGTDFGPGSLTSSGYPRISKEWKRGTPITAATTVFEAEPTDMAASTSVWIDPGFRREIVNRTMTFYTSKRFLRTDGKLVPIEVPDDANIGSWREYLFVTLHSDWEVGGTRFPTGSMLATKWDDFLAGKRSFQVLFTPGPRKSLANTASTRHHVVINELENVRNRLYVLTPQADGTWRREAFDAPAFGTVSLSGIDDETDDYWLSVNDFLTPPSLYRGTLGKPDRELLKSLPAFFDAKDLAISQHEAVSRDGTRIPYFQVGPRNLSLDGSNPTLLYGYGGFRLSQTPGYSAGRGVAWLQHGGVFVLANIRGGGEFGPSWHRSALKENRQKAYDDFIAIAEDLVARKVTSPKHLGIQGGSNGGLLMGVMLTQRPDLFGAVVCQVPLLDMRRYNKLLAGASWMGEYGNPDVPAEWEYISRYSPYQNVDPKKKYPRTLFTTSTRDDRVHPGHARKMMALLQSHGQDVLYYENIEGGHGGAANSRQSAFMSALAYTFLARELGLQTADTRVAATAN